LFFHVYRSMEEWRHLNTIAGRGLRIANLFMPNQSLIHKSEIRNRLV
jgi:hypothetical protein